MFNSTDNITVITGKASELRIMPDNVTTLTTDDLQNFYSLGYDRWGNLIGNLISTWYVIGAIGNVTPGPATSTVFDPTTPGTGRIVATNGTTANSTQDITIVTGAFFSLDIKPKAVTLNVSQYQEFDLSAADRDGNPIVISGTQWSTDVGVIEDYNDTWALFQSQDTVVTGGKIQATLGNTTVTATIDILPSGLKPVVKGTIPDQIKEEDSGAWSLDLKSYEPDNALEEWDLFWYVTNADTTLVSISGEMSKDRVLTFLPVANAHGSFTATFWLSTSEGLTDSQDVEIKLTPVNDAPTFIENTPSPLIVHYGKAYGFDYTPYIDDIDNEVEELSLTAEETDDSGHTTVSGLTVAYNFPEDYNGKEIIVTLTVSDGEDTALKVVTVQITDDTPPELLKSLPDITMFEGDTEEDVFKLNEYFSDPDNELIFFSSLTEHLEVAIDTDSWVDLTAEKDWYGDEFVTFRATDGQGALIEDTIIVHVLPFNDPPEFGDVPDLMVRYDAPYYFDLWPYIIDSDTPQEELMLIDMDPNMNISQVNHLTMVLTYPKALKGETLPLVLTVSDGESSATKTIQVTVSDNWPPERHAYIPDETIYEDQEGLGVIDLTIYFFDRDNDEIYFSLGMKEITVTIHDNGSVDLIPSPNWNGEEYITFRATDSKGALIEDTIKVLVVPVNDPPILAPLPDQEGEEGAMWKLDLIPYLEDIDDNVTTLSIWAVLPNGSNVDIVVAGTELVFFGTGDFQGMVTIFVSDGDDVVSRDINVTVTPLEDTKITPTEDSMAMYLLIILIAVIVLVLIILLLVFKRVYLGSYKIEEAFIVDRHGMCLAHRSRKAELEYDTDEDIFSGMLTVIQQFVKDSFKKTKDGDEKEEYLNMFKFGETTVFIEQGEYVFVAVFFKGTPGKTLQKKVQRFLGGIEKRYSNILKTWSGDMKSIAILGDKLGELVGSEGAIDVDAEKLKGVAQPLETSQAEPAAPLEPPKPEIEVEAIPELPVAEEEGLEELGQPPETEELPEMEMLALPEGEGELEEYSEEDEDLDEIDLDELDELDDLMDEMVSLDEE